MMDNGNDEQDIGGNAGRTPLMPGLSGETPPDGAPTLPRDPSDRARSLKREVEALYQNNVRPGSNRRLDTEVFEMSKFNDKLNKFERKRQLWLSSCSQESGTSADATYGRAFVAPVLPNTRRAADDTRNLIDDI